MNGSYVPLRILLNRMQECGVKREYKKLFEQVQQVLMQVGARGLPAQGMEFSPIDNNPRHGRVSLGHVGTVEVVQRLGQWWVMPQRS